MHSVKPTEHKDEAIIRKQGAFHIPEEIRCVKNERILRAFADGIRVLSEKKLLYILLWIRMEMKEMKES